jgi:plasmid stabilization system protein ParE
MARNVKWADAAWSDLQNIADYIARDSRYYAASFVREVRNAARSLERFAKKGREVPELGDSTVRQLPPAKAGGVLWSFRPSPSVRLGAKGQISGTDGLLKGRPCLHHEFRRISFLPGLKPRASWRNS